MSQLLKPPPRSPARVVGGLLGVAGGEAWRGQRGGFEPGVVTAAMLGLCSAYVRPDGDPVKAVQKYGYLPGPAWLLPVAFVRSGAARLDETSRLVAAVGLSIDDLAACQTFVCLASDLLVEHPGQDAVGPESPHRAGVGWKKAPEMSGIGPVDALMAARWALAQPSQGLAALASRLVQHCEPWIAAAALGVLGVREGCAGIPAQWYREVPCAQECIALGPRLLAAAQYPRREPDGEQVATFEHA